MHEVLPMLIDICRTYLPITVVYVLVHRQNAASIRVAERAGFVATTPLRQLDSADECCLSYQVIQS
jgi:RimJ/RimL family protein N-acetyltransferase